MKCPNKETPEFEAMIQSAKCLESKLEQLIWMPKSHGMLPTVVQICNTGADVVEGADPWSSLACQHY